MHSMENFSKDMISEPQYPEVNFDAQGFILDIGGGGEGIIGQYKKDQVIAIDKRKDELEEAPSENLKIIMDVTDLKFLDNTFNTVTAFFTFMYIDSDFRMKSLEEIYRVLKPGGKFFMWDATIPHEPENDKQEFFIVRIEVDLPHRKIKTGYGTPFKRHQKIDYYLTKAKEIGFDLIMKKEKGIIFYLEFIKKE
ncbi:MAG: class I SAM-dependent methyltransferase [Candidatus Heimdallarchaeota archaeon]|nr:class I SAM-dependent methyltransferase [Candidatus Heimdallarchaeota archaeon]